MYFTRFFKHEKQVMWRIRPKVLESFLKQLFGRPVRRAQPLDLGR